MTKQKIYQGKLNFKLIDFTCLIQISTAPKQKKLRAWATTRFEDFFIFFYVIKDILFKQFD